MPLDTTGLTPLDTEGLQPLDTTGLQPLSTEGLTPLDEPSAVTRGFVSGLLDQNPTLLSEAFEGAALLAPPEFKGTLNEWSAELKRLAKLAPEEYKTRSRGLFESRSAGEALEWLGEAFGQGVASTVPSITTGTVGAVTGRKIAGRTGGRIGGLGGALVPSFSFNYGELFRALKDEKVDPERAAEIAFYGAVPMAALDVGGVESMIARLGGTARRDAIRHIARRMAQEGIKGAKREGITEAAQEAVKEITVSLETGKPFFTQATAEKLIESGIAGAATGGGLGTVSGVRRDIPAEAPAQPAERREPTLLTPEDRASPIPDDLIEEGKQLIDDAQKRVQGVPEGALPAETIIGPDEAAAPPPVAAEPVQPVEPVITPETPTAPVAAPEAVPEALPETQEVTDAETLQTPGPDETVQTPAEAAQEEAAGPVERLDTTGLLPLEERVQPDLLGGRDVAESEQIAQEAAQGIVDQARAAGLSDAEITRDLDEAADPLPGFFPFDEGDRPVDFDAQRRILDDAAVRDAARRIIERDVAEAGRRSEEAIDDDTQRGEQVRGPVEEGPEPGRVEDEGRGEEAAAPSGVLQEEEPGPAERVEPTPRRALPEEEARQIARQLVEAGRKSSGIEGREGGGAVTYGVESDPNTARTAKGKIVIVGERGEKFTFPIRELRPKTPKPQKQPRPDTPVITDDRVRQRIENQRKAEEAGLPSPAPRKVIGQNERGQDIEEDARGVRSVSDGGVRRTENVAVGPRGEVSVNPAVRADEFKTAEERGETSEPQGETASEVEALGDRDITYDVKIEETGETAQITENAGQALAEAQTRVDTLQQLLDCLT